ncbi:hypothetical protein GCM10027443_31540 [Pontibacter brevis]
MHIGYFIGLVYSGEKELAKAFSSVAQKHKVEPEIFNICQKLSSWSEKHAAALLQFMERYSGKEQDEPEELRDTMFSMFRATSFGLVRDLQNLWVLVNEVKICCVTLLQGAYSLRDKELILLVKECNETADRQLIWLMSQIKHISPQVLVVA